MAVNSEWMQAFEAWLPELQERIPAALEAVTAGRDDVVGVALYTDADASTLIPAALTRKHRAELAAEYPTYAELYAWDPDEWDLQLPADQAGVLDPLMAKVRALAKEVDEENWRSFTILAWTWMTEGLKNLVQEGFFEASYPGANVSFWITDYHAHVDTMIEWAELLNPPERSAPYVAWLRANW